MQKSFLGGEAARLHYVILLFPIEVTHSSWIFWGGKLDWPLISDSAILLQFPA